MKIALVTSESNPFCKSGGLADVVYSLAKEFVSKGHEAMVILPYYESIHHHAIEKRPVGQFDVHMGWRDHTANVWEADVEGVRFFLIDDPFYFERENLYGYGDDGERFAFFSMAAKTMLEFDEFRPDLIHVHDWPSAIMPMLFAKDTDSPLHKVKTVLTIHNPAFLGLLDEDALSELFNLETNQEERDAMAVYGKVSTLLAGIRYSDLVTTVSPTHAEELRANNAYGIGDALVEKGKRFVGVVNGVDYDEFDPSTDPLIAQNFTLKTIKKSKIACKKALFESFGYAYHDGPLFVLVSRLYEQKGIPLVLQIIPHIVQNGGSVLVLGSGDFNYCNALTNLSNAYPGRVGIYLGYSQKIAHACYAGGDFFLMPSLFEPCGISQMIAQRYGCLPVARNTGGLHDTIDHMEDGILFNDYDEGGIRFGVDKAFEIYAQPELHAEMIKKAYRRDHSWRKSASSYLSLFRSIKKR